jgi:hypothetical protein
VLVIGNHHNYIGYHNVVSYRVSTLISAYRYKILKNSRISKSKFCEVNFVSQATSPYLDVYLPKTQGQSNEKTSSPGMISPYHVQTAVSVRSIVGGFSVHNIQRGEVLIHVFVYILFLCTYVFILVKKVSLRCDHCMR